MLDVTLCFFRNNRHKSEGPMRLITHNMLKSNIKGVQCGFPLGIEVVKTEEQELEFNAGAETQTKMTRKSPSQSLKLKARCVMCAANV